MPPHERSPSPTPSLEASPPGGDACTSPVRQHEEMMAVVSSHFHMEDLEYEVEMDEEDEEVVASSRSIQPTYQSRLDDTEATFLIETLTESMMDDGVVDEVDFHQLGRGKNSPTVGAAAAATAPDHHVTPKRQVRQRRPSTGASKSVSFHRVHVREYNQVLGDHPCCTNGPPVSLGWEHTQYDAVCFERYETARLDAPKRTRRQLKMNADARREVLRKQAQKQADAAAAAAASHDDSGRRSPDSAVQNLLDEDEENDLLLEDAIMSSGAGGNKSSLESAEEIRRAEQRLMRVKERHQTLTGFVYDAFFPSPTADHNH